MQSICAFGCFDPSGARSWVIRTGLEKNGYSITFCNTSEPGLVRKFLDLVRRWKEMAASADALYVVFLGHYYMPLAWWLGKRRGIPVILDAFLSLYDTDVCDRRRFSPWSPHAWLLWLVDFFACHLASVVLLETEEHKEYFMRRYALRPEKILVLPIGSRTDLFLPEEKQEASHQSFIVEFHGSFIPLQGIETILRAAKELSEEPVIFDIIGKGQTYPAMRTLAQELKLTNVRFSGNIPMEEIPARLHSADICLGIFGSTAKTQRVIPTKAYEILNCGCPMITARTPAIERLLRDRCHALLVPAADPKALAQAIVELKNDSNLRENIAQNGRRLSLELFQPTTIVTPLVTWLKSRLHG